MAAICKETNRVALRDVLWTMKQSNSLRAVIVSIGTVRQDFQTDRPPKPESHPGRSRCHRGGTSLRLHEAVSSPPRYRRPLIGYDSSRRALALCRREADADRNFSRH